MSTVDGSIKGKGWTKIDFRGYSSGKSRFLDITEQYALGRTQWRQHIHLSDPIDWDLRLSLVWFTCPFHVLLYS